MADDDAKRLRLVELRSNNGFPRAVRFAPRLTLVTGFGSPERVGAWIAAALVGPRPDGVEGTVEVAGREVALGDLPATLLPPRSSIVVADTDLEAARRRAVEPRFRRVVLRRQGAEADRAREEIARNTAAGRFAALEHRLAELEPALADTIQRAAADEQRAQTITSLKSLLSIVTEAEIAAREPDPEALDLASEWLTLRAQRAELAAAQPHLSVADAQRRVEVSEGALDQARQHRATADDVGRLYALQRAVNEASPEPTDEDAAVEGSDAREAALATEREALRELGHTHASFLISVVAPRSDEEIRQAEAALAAAREELRQAETVAALPTWPEIAQRQLDLRGKAAGVLGRFPGDDVAGELYAFRPGAPAHAEARAELEAGLTTAGLDTEPDVETAAGAWLDEQERQPPIDHGPRLAELSEERETVETDLRSQAAELVAIAARLRDLDRRLDELAMQESRIAAELATDLGRCAPDDIEHALHDVLAEFVSGGRVPGRLPIVVAGALTAFGTDTREPTLRELEQASEQLQVVLIVDDPEVEAWATSLGPDASVWSPDVAARIDAEEKARRDAEENARREAEQRAVREAEERARREHEERSSREPASGPGTVRSLPYSAPAGVLDLVGVEEDEGVEVHTATSARLAPPTPAGPTPEPTVVRDGHRDVPEPSDAHVIDATEIIDATGAAGSAVPGDVSVGAVETDDWWIPIVARPGASRATRPVGEDLAQRRRRAEQLAADATTLTVHCDVHRNVDTTLHCARCALPFCDQCLAVLGEPPALHCVDCALELSGVRTGHNQGHTPEHE